MEKTRKQRLNEISLMLSDIANELQEAGCDDDEREGEYTELADTVLDVQETVDDLLLSNLM